MQEQPLVTRSDNATPHAAHVYDRGVRQTIPFYETIHAETLNLVKTIRPDVACWLDTGCGTGFLVSQALPIFPHTRFIVADPSEGMLQQARRRLAGQEQRVQFLPPVDSQGLLVYRGQFSLQVITAILCHHYQSLEARRQSLYACRELLEQDGALVVVENISPDSEQGTQIGLDRWQRFQLEQGRSEADVAEHLARFNTRFFPISVHEHVDLLRQAGFRVVELFWYAQMQAGFYALK